MSVYLVTQGGQAGPVVVQRTHRSARGVFTVRISPGTVPPMSRLGEVLEDERTRRGMTQMQAAVSLGVSQATYSRYARGHPAPLYKAAAIAKFLRTPLPEVRELVMETHDQPAKPEVSPRPTVEERVGAIEQAIEHLTDRIVSLQQTPKRRADPPDGKRAQPRPQKQGSRASAR